MRCVFAMPDPVLLDPDELQREIADVVELVARQNRFLVRKLGPRRIPPLYESGVLYRRDPWGSGLQHFPDCLTVIERGFADCKGLVPYRLAQLREEFPQQLFAVRVYPRRLPGGEFEWHLQVQKPDGIEDPSRLLHQ
jgi:hypothetical protein